MEGGGESCRRRRWWRSAGATSPAPPPCHRSVVYCQQWRWRPHDRVRVGVGGLAPSDVEGGGAGPAAGPPPWARVDGEWAGGGGVHEGAMGSQRKRRSRDATGSRAGRTSRKKGRVCLLTRDGSCVRGSTSSIFPLVRLRDCLF
jgi:hypothetical protein